MRELFKELGEFSNKDMEGAIIKCDEYGCQIKGSPSAVLTLLTHIFKGLMKSGGLDEEDILKALKVANMDDKELNKELLKQMKIFFENMKEQLEEEE